MWQCIFNSETNRGVACNRAPQAGEFAKEIDPKNCKLFDVHPTRYVWDEVSMGLVEWPTWRAEETAAAKELTAMEIRKKYSILLRDMVKPYSDEERESFMAQEGEARQWLLDNNSACPLVRAMANSRGITMELMVAKIIENADLYRQGAGYLLGLQQKELDELYA